jgi:mono/diheme cytochrome c family protein
MKKAVIFGSIALGLFMTSFRYQQKAATPWKVPAADAKVANPVKSDAASIATGKSLWATHCKSCHGSKGLGDGSKAAQLKTEPGDFSTADFQAQSDASLFYKMSEGREDMPSFKKKLPDADDRWAIINFMRTLKK